MCCIVPSFTIPLSHHLNYITNLLKDMDLENAKAQMRKGVLEMCILAIISEEEVYPSDIIMRLKENDLIVVEGTLYPLLTRLKNDGLLDYSWRESTNGPPRKYFKVSDLGKQFLEGLTNSWQQLVQSVNQTIVPGESKYAPKPTENQDLPRAPDLEVVRIQPVQPDAESPYFAS
jgi:PadR family transcriptional regulator, regulatory protein PadR